MSESLAILFLTTFISFVGSIQPGPVNLAVVQATLSCNFKTGIWVAISGTLPEIICTTIALKSQSLLIKNQKLFEALEVAVIPFFFSNRYLQFLLHIKIEHCGKNYYPIKRDF